MRTGTWIGLTVFLLLIPSGVIGQKSAAGQDPKLDEAYTEFCDVRIQYFNNLFCAEDQEAMVKSTLLLANIVMTSDALGAKEKYPWSLSLYRLAEQMSPGNAEAGQNIEMIESIYQQMGRPVPKG